MAYGVLLGTGFALYNAALSLVKSSSTASYQHYGSSIILKFRIMHLQKSSFGAFKRNVERIVLLCFTTPLCLPTYNSGSTGADLN